MKTYGKRVAICTRDASFRRECDNDDNDERDCAKRGDTEVVTNTRATLRIRKILDSRGYLIFVSLRITSGYFGAPAMRAMRIFPDGERRSHFEKTPSIQSAF